ncbi:hypothetical protein [Alkalimarinus alittae]|uniref:Outer membrane insertion C-signal n=1 Tax=Alkalimarinus alittae TaxID=2961619 RepID=A0ABY6N1T4_9ALTE|nr:hypothetical protein [Alkalimarinus alittae]UZE96044.1 hypothetical protein NKI27_18665 [Alkalimarinus alittae]
MRHIKPVILSAVFALSSSTIAHAEENPLSGAKLGFGHDKGFGLTGQLGKFNGFIGNDGLAVDYIIVREKIEAEIPLHWYIAGGGYIDWRGDDDFGLRSPVGLDLNFAKGWDAYVQVIPELEIVQEFEFGLDAAIGVRYQF